MVEDVRLSVDRDAEVYFYGRPPGSLPTPEEILEEIKKTITKSEIEFRSIEMTKLEASKQTFAFGYLDL